MERDFTLNMLGQKRDGLITIRFRFVNTYTYFQIIKEHFNC